MTTNSLMLAVHAANGVPVRGLAAGTYALRSIARNRRATASALVGLVLGVAVVAAPWVSLDSSLRGLIQYYEGGLSVDVVAEGRLRDLDAAAGDLRAVRNVQVVEPLGSGFLIINGTRSGLPPKYGVFFAPLQFVRATFDAVAPRQGITWGGPPANGTIVLAQSFADDGVTVGAPIVLERRVPIYDPNGTYLGEDVRDATIPVGGFYRSAQPIFGFNVAFLALDNVPWLRGQLNMSEDEIHGFLEAWLDRDALIDPFDLGGSRTRLERQRVLMENALEPHAYFAAFVRSPRGPSLDEIPNAIEAGALGLRLLFLAFAIPTLVIAALLARVGFDVGLATRRRELAVLRARGASVRSIRVHFFVEATVLGLVASLAGLGLALALSRFLQSGFFSGSSGTLPPPGLAVAPGTVYLAVFFGWVLAAGVSRTPARLVASEDLVAALKSFHAGEASIEYRPSKDFLLAGIAAAGFLLLLAWGSIRGAPLGPLTFILGISAAFITPLAPFFLTVALARYMTRGTSRPYRELARLFRRRLGDLHVLVDRNLVRSPRRSANTAMIVTFVVGFVVGVSALAGSADAYRERQLRLAVPSDLVADLNGSPVSGLFNASTRAAVLAVPGVASVVRVVVTYSLRSPVFLFDADAYLNVVPWVTAADLGGVDPSSLLTALSVGDSFAANTPFRERYGLEPGDVLRFDGVLGASASLRLKAYVPVIPGLIGSTRGEFDAAYMGFSAVPTANLSTADSGRYLISLQPGANETAVIAGVSSVLRGFPTITSQRQAREQEAANPVAGTVFGNLRAQSYMSVLILVVAVGLLVYSAAAERQDEFATMMARGLDARRAARLLTAEGWVVCLLGLGLGVLGGAVTAWTFLAVAGSFTTSQVPFVLPWTTAVPIAAILGGTWVAGLSGAWFLRRIDVPRLLKLRGG